VAFIKLRRIAIIRNALPFYTGGFGRLGGFGETGKRHPWTVVLVFSIRVRKVNRGDILSRQKPSAILHIEFRWEVFLSLFFTS
jgi:hypothetical protein